MQINAVEKVDVLCGLEVDGRGTATKVRRMLICTALQSLAIAGMPACSSRATCLETEANQPAGRRPRPQVCRCSR